jgi:ubiquinone/menaquinone biosynthesis C-methylase UbiE
MEIAELEREYVTNTYNAIARKFSDTRYNVWPSVSKFINSVDITSKLFEAGCGNGKNMLIRPTQFTGIDSSDELVKICVDRGLNVQVGDICDCPFEDKSFDHSICIAVLHHLSTPIRRLAALKELRRVTKHSVLIEVWSYEHYQFRPKDKVCSELIGLNSFTTIEPNPQDRMIEFNSNDKTKNHRYYHFFTKEEICELIKLALFEIDEIYEEAGNWIIVTKS